MKISEEIGKIIMAGGNAIEIAHQAKAENIPDLSLEEANRVTKD